MTARYSRILRTVPFIIAICLVSLPAFAKYSGGTGEPNDPYQIATARDLIDLGNEPNDYDKHFILAADIDLDPNLPGGKVFDKAVIAPDTNDIKSSFQGTKFAGVFDGNGHVINNLHIQGDRYLGLFGYLDTGAVIANLGLEAVNVNGTGSFIGGLAGYNYDGSIESCYSTGAVNGYEDVGGLAGSNWFGDVVSSYSTGTISGDDFVGGLVGDNGGDIDMCYSTAKVSGNEYVGGLVGDSSGYINMCYSTANVSGNGSVGGLVGSHDSFGNISSSFSTGTVTGEDYVGGLVGSNLGLVTLCYSNSTVNGQFSVGGLAGVSDYYGEIHNCYSSGRVSGTSYIGGLIGWGEGIVTNNVWDIEASGQVSSIGGLGLTTAEMMDSSMLGLNGFANNQNWVLNPGLDYPRLAWEGTPGQIIPEPEIDWLEGDGTTEQPYRIIAADQLILLGKASILCDKSFILGADIYLDPNLPDGQVFEWAVIPKFTGIFDGNDHVISNLTISGGSYLGLFGQLENGAEIRNLGIFNSNVTGSGDCIGGLAGYNYLGSVTKCYSTGSITGNWLVGGLVGINEGDIITCYSTVTVTGYYHVGGLVGGNGSNVAMCYSTGSVSGDRFVGGLVGVNSGESRTYITNCYSTDMVTGNEDVGGLVGKNGSIGTITSCFWDMKTSEQITSDGGTGKTTAQMYDPNTFMAEGWDFVGKPDGPHDIWIEPEGGGYPIFWWQSPSEFALPVFAGGKGKLNDPYIISTAEQLNSIGYNTRLMESHFKLINNLDAEDLHFYPIGNGNIPYSGIFDGNGYTVSNVTIEGESYLGFFSYIGEGAEVKNLGVVDVNITGSGGYIGGLVGLNIGDIDNCFSTGTVIGESRYVGGLVGCNYYGTITNNYSNCSVTGDRYIGGLVGYNYNGEIFMCYSSGAVNIDRDDCGLSGGSSDGIIAFCFWDEQTSGQRYSHGGFSRGTADMQTESTFTNAGWDFEGETDNGTDDIWWIDEGNDYPRLWWEKI